MGTLIGYYEVDSQNEKNNQKIDDDILTMVGYIR